MDDMQSFSSHHDSSRCKTISDLITSVATEHAALTRIPDAAPAQIEKTTDLCGVDVDDLIEIDESVERVLNAVTRLELALQLKLALFEECLCPGTPCRGDEHHSCKA